MSKSLSEFTRFLQQEHQNLSEFEKKLARLILDDFKEIEGTGTAGGKRAKRICELIDVKGGAVETELNLAENASGKNDEKVTRLTKITVANFRGFSSQHTLEFNNPYTFIYGPNGTGKSSLCEALEYALLGTINEADAKRIDVRDYVQNSITKRSELPQLFGKSTNSTSEIRVKADIKNYEFCFIEKNRIDGFARVAANTPAAQQTRLAALFGLEEFNTFCTQFTDRFENYVDLVGKKQVELSGKEREIAGHRAILLKVPDDEKEIQVKTTEFLKLYPTMPTLDAIKTHISGTDAEPGLLHKNHAEIARLNGLAHSIDPGIDSVMEEVKTLNALIEERRSAREFIRQYKEELSLAELYKALLKVKEKSENNCPACSSQIYSNGQLQVPIDPYKNADIKLVHFEEAIKKEGRIQEILAQLQGRWPKLESKLEKLNQVARQINFTKTLEVGAIYASCETVKDSKSLEDILSILSKSVDLFIELKTAIVTFNVEITRSKESSKSIESANFILNQHLTLIADIKASEDQLKKQVLAANTAITSFNNENQALFEAVVKEAPSIQLNVKYATAYSTFRDKLLNYNSNLPITLAADLNDKALKFYNMINKNDHDSDLLVRLSLPTTAGKKIEIGFAPNQKFDALQILSEGHIRCLGLAILLAKIVRDDLPFLIFDDVVNSIDDEHRGGIVDLILGDTEIKNRQLIITTHGEEFVKRLENAVPKAAYKAMVTRIDFLSPVDAKKIIVKLDSPRHYLEVAERSLLEGKVRDSLSYLRKSLEEILNRLWKKIASKNFTVQLQVGLRGPGSTPDLMALAQSLQTFLEKKDVTVFQGVIPELAAVIGKRDTHALVWNYLNKGTHEEDRTEEFDAPMVRDMFKLITSIEAAMESGGKSTIKSESPAE